ncbi:MAG TPA: methyltransferase [Chloroflexota bacterium]|nr:methyltransferase [Chloroflexota bacterium]
MPISLSLIERVLLRVGVVPAPLVDFAQHAAFRLLMAGYRLGVFEALDEGPHDLAALSARLEASPAALEPFLDLLQRLGYVSVHGGRYANTGAATRWLTQRSPESLSGIAGFLEDHIRRWDHLEETIRAGRPPFTAYDDYARHPDRWQPFHDGMRAIASFSVDEVARKARLPGGPLRLIDVGGSHGLYTIALCRRYPGLSAVIYDWPEGVAAARKEIAQAGLAARIGTQTGDFLTDDLGRGYDVALLGNIIHGQKPPAIVDLLGRLRAALNEGGRLLIVDQVRMRQPFTRFAGYTAQMIGLFLLNELGGGIYPYIQVRAWLHETGYGDVRVRRLLRAPGNVLIQAAATSRGPAPELR